MEPVYTPRLWQLVMTGFVALFGAVVLWMVLNPNVADDYRAYYIDRSASCFPRVTSNIYPLGAPATFVEGRNGYRVDTIRWCGFMPMKKDGIKSFGDYGILKMKFDIPNEDLLLTFSSWANTTASKPARDVAVVVNGEKVATVTYASALMVRGRVVIPAAVARSRGDELEIRFEVPRIAPPGTNSEPVTLQLRLEAVRVVPISQAPPPATTRVGAPNIKKADPRWAPKQGGGVSPAP